MKAPEHLKAWALFERRAGRLLKELSAATGFSHVSVSNWCVAARVDPAHYTSHPSPHRAKRFTAPSV